MRRIIELNDNWKFVKPAGDKQLYISDALNINGTNVELPHTWNAKDGQDGGNDYFRGECMYVRSFNETLFEADECVYLEVPGAAMSARVYLNGKELAKHEGGYSAFRVDLTEALEEENVLAILVDNSENDRVYPQKADFTFYGGLYRGVKLMAVPKTHFSLDYYGAPAIKVSAVPCGEVSADSEKSSDFKVEVELWIDGDAASAFVSVAGMEQTAAIRDGYAKAFFTIKNAHLWDGIFDPYLYTATARLESGDEISTRFGCRSFKTDPDIGFILNGRPYPLRGVSRHQDFAGVGNALSIDMHKKDMELIKEIGANTIRLAHYQHAQEFYDLCDENGMIVWAEIPYITQHMDNGTDNTLSQMRELVVQNYNHPSIICWGLSNEISASGGVNEAVIENHRMLNDLCHELDKTRFTTMANVFMLETDSPLLEIPDVNSYNLYFGWYLGELKQNDSFFDEYHKKFPKRCIGFSEYGADANTRFQSAQPVMGDYTESYQTVYHEHMLEMIEARPWLWATHVWNMFDFGADGRDEGGEHGKNQKGLVTIDRRLKKDAFYLYKAYWNKTQPFVHICGRRFIDRTEEETVIKVYSNTAEVQLYVDGREYAVQKGRPVFKFNVKILGEHLIEARACGQTDSIKIRRVDQPNPEYMFGRSGNVTNWFDAEIIKRDYFSVKDTMGELGRDEHASKIVGALMEQAAASRGDVAQSVKDNENLQKMMMHMTLESLLRQAGEAVSKEQVKALNGALQQIKKPDIR